MRHLPALAAFALAGCHAAEPVATDTAQPNADAVLSQLENEQDAIDDDIANDAGAVAPLAAAGNAYSCDNGMAVQAEYENGNTAKLTIAGKTYILASIPAASGAKYGSQHGLAPGKRLTWWAKDNGAMLMQGPVGVPEGGPHETIADCLATTPDKDDD